METPRINSLINTKHKLVIEKSEFDPEFYSATITSPSDSVICRGMGDDVDTSIIDLECNLSCMEEEVES